MNRDDAPWSVWLGDSQLLMRRIIVSMQSVITHDNTLENRSYCELMLRLSEPDLVREFAVAMTEAVASIGINAFPCDFSFELMPPELADTEASDFVTSNAKYKQLCASPEKLIARTVSPFNKDFFLNPLEDAFKKARIGSTEIKRMMPYARRALDQELLQFYELIAAES
jgi:hypothetical protein